VTGYVVAVTANRRGSVIIGRFLPPHVGHQYLIRTAEAHRENVTVFLCSLPGEAIPGEVRLSWMRASFPNVRLVHITEAIAEAARDKPDAPRIWARAVMSRLDCRPRYVFASESYGAAFAEALGAEFVEVDIQRGIVPVSGSQIRADLCGRWEQLLPTSYSYFATRISLAGIDSTIAMELTCQLAGRFGTVAVTGLPGGDNETDADYAASYLAMLPQARCVVFSESDPIAVGASLPATVDDMGDQIAQILPNAVIVTNEPRKIDFVRYDQYHCDVIRVSVADADQIEEAVRDYVKKRWLARFRLGPYSVGQNGASPGQENR
jgi:cytidyltransferase-like protein